MLYVGGDGGDGFEDGAVTLAQLRYFLAIVDSGFNITAAAERVFATQPGLSKQLKQLEEELGCQLFGRRGRALDGLTRAGEEVAARARAILTEAANIRAVAANERREVGGDLWIETTQMQARYALPPMLAVLGTRYPAVSVHLTLGPGEAADIFAERSPADLGIVSTPGPPPSADLALPLYRWERLAIVPATHPLAATTPTLADLALYPLVASDVSAQSASSIVSAFRAAGLAPRFAYTAPDAEVIKTYVRAGLGVGLIAEMAHDPVADADLVAVALPELFPTCTTWAVLRRDRVLRDYVVELLLLLCPRLTRRALKDAVEGGGFSDPLASVPSWALWIADVFAGDDPAAAI